MSMDDNLIFTYRSQDCHPCLGSPDIWYYKLLRFYQKNIKTIQVLFLPPVMAASCDGAKPLLITSCKITVYVQDVQKNEIEYGETSHLKDMKKVTCVIVGNEDVDKKELLVRISTDLSPKKPNEKCTSSSIGNVLDTTASCLTQERNDQAVVETNPRFQVLHNEEDVQSDDEEEEEIPDHWEGEINVEGKSYHLFVTNATSQDVFHQSTTRSLYQEADIFLVCFSVSNLFTSSLEAVVKKWVPEIREVCPVTPFILVGTQINWRELFDPTDPSQRPITPETGALYAEKVGAVRYMECSTDDSAAVRYIFNETVRFSFMDRMELSQLHSAYMKYGSTLLHQAVQCNHESSVEALAYVMDINVKDKAGRSPLDLAVRNSHMASARCLIKNGCAVGLTNEDWCKRCEFWIDNHERLNKVHKNINELARKLLNLYASLQDPLPSNLIVIGQHGIEVCNFLTKSAPFIAIQSLAIAKCQGSCTFHFSHLNYSLHTLTITNCDIGGEIPNSIFSTTSLEALSLVDNGIISVPTEISKLKSLRRLRLSRNKIKSLPDVISGLVKLRFLFCDNNYLEQLPDQIGCLGDLEVLDISHNKLEKLSVSLGLLTKLKCLKYCDNRLTFPPAEVIKQGSDEVLAFLNTFLDEPVRNTQVKVSFVGGEGVGKSTLILALRSKKSNVLASMDKTYGIEISDFEFNHSLRMKVLDFCGDPAFLVPHSLFITENSLYQVCFDMSQYAISKAAGLTINQLGRLQLWLEIIHSQAPASHVIIVATNVGHPNLTDDLRHRAREDVEEMISRYREEHKKQFEGEPVAQCVLCDGTHLCDVSSSHFYIAENRSASTDPSSKPDPCLPHIVGYYEVSCKEQYPKVLLGSKNISLQKYKCNLSIKMEMLLSTGYLIPHKCLYIRDRIFEILNSSRHLQEQPILTLTRVREIALGCGMRDEFKLKAMLRYFHNQGEFLWFEDISELNDIVIVNPQWLADRLRTLYTSHVINEGILRIDYLEKIWPDVSKSERTLLVSLCRGLGLAFPCSDVEDLYPNLLPHGYPDRQSWPRQPLPGSHQVTVEFAFSFLPPSFFSDLVIAANKRELICPDLAEPSYLRFNLVFATNLKALEGCLIHSKEAQVNPLQGNSSDQTHTVHLESWPQERTIRATVRGPSPCCVMPEIRVAIKSVSDVFYQGIRFVETYVCPTCEITKFTTSKKPQYLFNLNTDENTCSKGHSVGSKVDIVSGRITSDVHLTVVKPKSAIGAAVKNSRNFLDDSCCPKLFIVLPIGFKSPPFRDCVVLDHVIDGHAAHFLCECPGYWHLVTTPGYRVPNLDEFFETFGPRVCKLMKLIFMTGEDHSETHTYASLRDILLKIVIGDPSLQDIMVEDIRSILDHYCNIYPNLIQGCSSFLYEDVEYLASGKDLSRAKLARLLDIFPEGRNFGPLVCTYSERHKERMWLCRKHAQPAIRGNQGGHET